MAENLTQPTDADVDAFLDSVPDERRRAEGYALRRLMERVTGEPDPLIQELGPHTTGKGCIYVKKLDVVREDVLEQLIRQRVEQAKGKNSVG